MENQTAQFDDRVFIKSEKTFECKIYVGLGIGYSGQSHPIEKAKDIIQKYVDEIGWCVTVTETEYIYKNGREPGLIIGIINYPRFPIAEKDVETRALGLAKKLLFGLDQYRLTLVTPNDTILLANPYKIDAYEKEEEKNGKK